MSLYAIGDFHLSFTVNKPMDVFDKRWKNHVVKIEKYWKKKVTERDAVVITGDHSWGWNLEECQADLDFIMALPGRKILLRGNHDMFWDAKKTEKLNEMFKGKLERLRCSFEVAKAAGYEKFIMFLHYPPTSIGEMDEHLSLVGLLNGKLSQLFTECYLTDSYITKLYEYMVYYRDNLANISLKAVCQKAENDLESARKAELLTRNEEKTFLRVNTFLENIWLKMEGITQAECDIYEKVKEAFSREADGLEKQTETVDQTLQNVFDFMEAAFGDSQEMVAFITELNANFYSIWFIRENGSDQYYRHNKGLLFDDRQKLILGQMEELESTMKRGITDGV